MVFNLFLISIIVVCIVDISGFVDTVKSTISKILTNGKFNTADYQLKPFDCSLCMSWWLGLIYLIIYNSVSLLNIAILLLIAISTPIIHDTIRLILDILNKIITKIYNKIQ